MYLINKMNFKSGYIAQLAILIVTITIIDLQMPEDLKISLNLKVS